MSFHFGVSGRATGDGSEAVRKAEEAALKAAREFVGKLREVEGVELTAVSFGSDDIGNHDLQQPPPPPPPEPESSPQPAATASEPAATETARQRSTRSTS